MELWNEWNGVKRQKEGRNKKGYKGSFDQSMLEQRVEPLTVVPIGVKYNGILCELSRT